MSVESIQHAGKETRKVIVRRKKNTYSHPGDVRVTLGAGTRIAFPIVLCAVPFVVGNVVVDTSSCSVARFTPTADEV